MRPVRGKRPRLVTIGDLTLDIVVRQEAGFESGTDVPAQISFRAGGSAANTARVFAGLGGAATFIGAVGDDRMGDVLRKALKQTGVTVHVFRSHGPTARLVVSLATNGERSFLTDRGTADSLAWRDIKPIWLERADVLHLPAYSLLTPPMSDTAREAARHAHAAGTLVSVDLASRRPLLAGGSAAARARIAAVEADVLFANHDEAAALVGPRGLRRLLELAPVAVVKAGAAGCAVFWTGDAGQALQIDLATRYIAAADTTGAGDAFDAGFLHAYIAAREGGPAGAAGAAGAAGRGAVALRRAALAGQRAASAFLGKPRVELTL